MVRTLFSIYKVQAAANQMGTPASTKLLISIGGQYMTEDEAFTAVEEFLESGDDAHRNSEFTIVKSYKHI